MIVQNGAVQVIIQQTVSPEGLPGRHLQVNLAGDFEKPAITKENILQAQAVLLEAINVLANQLPNQPSDAQCGAVQIAHASHIPPIPH